MKINKYLDSYIFVLSIYLYTLMIKYSVLFVPYCYLVFCDCILHMATISVANFVYTAK